MSSDPIVRILRQVAPANRDVMFEQETQMHDGSLETTYIGVVIVPLVELGQRLTKERIGFDELTCRPNSDGSALRLFWRRKGKGANMKFYETSILVLLLVIAFGLLAMFK